MADTASGRRSRKLSLKGAIMYLVAFGFFTGGMFILASAFDVPGLKPATESCRPAIEVANPAAHTECTAYIDALRTDAFYGAAVALAIGLVIFVINRGRDRSRSGMTVGIILGFLVAAAIFLGGPAIMEALDNNDSIVGEAAVRGGLATLVWLLGLTLFMRWDYVIARFKPRRRRSSS